MRVVAAAAAPPPPQKVALSDVRSHGAASPAWRYGFSLHSAPCAGRHRPPPRGRSRRIDAVPGPGRAASRSHGQRIAAVAGLGSTDGQEKCAAGGTVSGRVSRPAAYRRSRWRPGCDRTMRSRPRASVCSQPSRCKPTATSRRRLAPAAHGAPPANRKSSHCGERRGGPKGITVVRAVPEMRTLPRWPTPGAG